MPTGTYGQFSTKASVHLPTGAYHGTTNYRNALHYPPTMVCQPSVTPVVPRGQLPCQGQPAPISATIPTRWCSTAAAQANQPLCRQLVPTVVSSAPPSRVRWRRKIYVSVLHHGFFTSDFQRYYNQAITSCSHDAYNHCQATTVQIPTPTPCLLGPSRLQAPFPTTPTVQPTEPHQRHRMC
jgi:hypothetical protein